MSLGDPNGLPIAGDLGSSQNEIACPEKNLLLAVLERAVRDLDYGQVEPHVRRQAIQWFRAAPPRKHKQNRRWRSITWYDVRTICQFSKTQLDYIEEKVRCAEKGYDNFREIRNEELQDFREKKSKRARKSQQRKGEAWGAGVVSATHAKRSGLRVEKRTTLGQGRWTRRRKMQRASLLSLRSKERRQA